MDMRAWRETECLKLKHSEAWKIEQGELRQFSWCPSRGASNFVSCRSCHHVLCSLVPLPPVWRVKVGTVSYFYCCWRLSHGWLSFSEFNADPWVDRDRAGLWLSIFHLARFTKLSSLVTRFRELLSSTQAMCALDFVFLVTSSSEIEYLSWP